MDKALLYTPNHHMKSPGSIDDLQHQRSVFELRYPRAHRFWDISGQLIGQIEREMPGLTCEGLQDGGFRFPGKPSSGLQLAMYSWDRLTVEPHLDSTNKTFADNCSKFWAIIREALQIESIWRVGHRQGYFFGGDESPEDLLKRLDVWQPGGGTASFGGPSCDGIALRFENALMNRRIRLEVTTGTAKVKGADKKGVGLDIDFASMAPPPLDVDVADFVKVNHRFLRENLHKVLR